MSLIHTTTTTRTRIGLTAAAVCLAVTPLAADAAADPTLELPPPWEWCVHRDHPAAADLGPVMPTHWQPPAEVVAVLRGETEVGTDCSIYDPMMLNP